MFLAEIGRRIFNPCRNLAKRRTGVQAQIARAGRKAGGNTAALRANFKATGCTSGEKRKETPLANSAGERRQETTRANPDRMASVKNTMLFCVRVTDGYFFPAPNSQFVGMDHVENTLDRCRFICGTEDVEVYTLDDIALESEEMASVKDGRSYKDLPDAFAYRDAPHFKGCDFGRYHRQVNEARARSVTPYNMDDAIIPLPSPRPTPPAVASAQAAALYPGIDPTTTSDSGLLDLDAIGASASDLRMVISDHVEDETAGGRRIRIVGPAFLPDEEGTMDFPRRGAENATENRSSGNWFLGIASEVLRQVM